MKCREARGLLVALSNDEVTRSERLLTQAHLAGCPACRTEFEALAETRRRLMAGLKARAAGAMPSTRAWAGIQGRLAPQARTSWRGAIPLARVASAAAMAVALFGVSFALNPLTRARLVSEAATATPQFATAQPVLTATPVVSSEPGQAETTLTPIDPRREMARERDEAPGRDPVPPAAPIRQPRRGIDRFETPDSTFALDSAPVVEELETPCNVCAMLN